MLTLPHANIVTGGVGMSSPRGNRTIYFRNTKKMLWQRWILIGYGKGEVVSPVQSGHLHIKTTSDQDIRGSNWVWFVSSYQQSIRMKSTYSRCKPQSENNHHFRSKPLESEKDLFHISRDSCEVTWLCPSVHSVQSATQLVWWTSALN